MRKTEKKTARFRLLPLILLPATMVCSLPAYAEYSFQVVSPPGAVFTQAFGVNNAGKVTGNADDGLGSYGFVYDMKSGEYTEIDDGFSALDISNSGVMAGHVDGVCAIRDKKGNITTFVPPSDDGTECSARGVNASGKVSGYVIDALGVWTGFVHDPKKGTFEEFLPSAQTIAHAINSQGQVAGSVTLDADVAYTGSPAGRYGFLRQKDGSIKYFAISDSQSFPGQTRGRGISESGLIAGFFRDPVTFDIKSFVTTLSAGPEFEEITLDADEVLYQSPCDPDIPPPPGPGYVLLTDVYASQVRNDGVVVGNCFDAHFNGTTGDIIVYGAGFIATPDK